MVKGKSKFKTLLSVFAALFLAVAFSGCGQYTPPSDGSSSNPSTPTEPDNPDNPDIPTPPQEDLFTVNLTYFIGYQTTAPFTANVYKNVTSLQVQWTDKNNAEVFRANFNDKGVATRSGLDGDYVVTLVNLPDGYTYRPNDYSADNDNREVTVELYAITPISLSDQPYGGGDNGFGGFYYYTVDKADSAYRITLHSEEEKVFFMFSPQLEGAYSVESLVDVTADAVNPKIDVHYGNRQFISSTPVATQDGGGESATYTKNFKWDYNISAKEVGGVFIFRIYSTARDDVEFAYGKTGLDVDFIISRNGSFKSPYEQSEDVPVPDKEYFDSMKADPLFNPAGTYTCIAALDPDNPRRFTTRCLDKDRNLVYEIKLNEEDGYYWYYDRNGTARGRVYANLTGNPFVSFADGNQSSKLYYLAPDGDSKAKNYYNFVQAYMRNSNDSGCVPVDGLVKTFLEDYAVAQRLDLFYDGRGGAESSGYTCQNEGAMWLFACGFYR